MGSNEGVKINFRIIAATNKDLGNALRKDRFAATSISELNAVTINMPALREIPQDIPLLARYYAEDFAAGSTAARSALPMKPWNCSRAILPGNVRELANTIRRAVALSDANTIGIYDFSAHLQQSPSADVSTTAENNSSPGTGGNGKEPYSPDPRKSRKQQKPGRAMAGHPPRHLAAKTEKIWPAHR